MPVFRQWGEWTDLSLTNADNPHADPAVPQRLPSCACAARPVSRHCAGPTVWASLFTKPVETKPPNMHGAGQMWCKSKDAAQRFQCTHQWPCAMYGYRRSEVRLWRGVGSWPLGAGVSDQGLAMPQPADGCG
jgi:hypothetical protein